MFTNTIKNILSVSKKFICILSLMSLFSSITSGQGEMSKWYFGWQNGLDLSTSPPTLLAGNPYAMGEPSATISDSLGNLLLYTYNGKIIFNANHDTIVNGAGLYGASSSHQGALFLPSICNENEYYFFTTSSEEQPPHRGFNYSKIEFSDATGFYVSEKNINLLPDALEAFTAIKHDNNVDIWIIAHGFDNAYYSFLLTEDGIDTTAVISSGFQIPSYRYTSVAVNLPGDTIVYHSTALDYFEFLHFDRLTGTTSLIWNDSTHWNDAVFSPSGRFLYTVDPYINSGIFQYDLSLGNITDILNDRVHFPGPFYSGIQHGLDGKIYALKILGSVGYFSAINNPNQYGLACNIVAAVTPTWNISMFQALPNIPHWYLLDNYWVDYPNCHESIQTYNCINNACIDPQDGSGLYDSLATCQAACNATAIEENEAEKQLLKITDVLGRESKPAPNVPLFYRYDDGTVEKRIVVE